MTPIALIGLLSWAGTHPATRTVCPVGCDHTTIQDAVDASDDGDTIEVAAGTYVERVQITKDLIVRGEGAAVTTVDGAAAGYVFNLSFADVTLSDMTIANGTSGVRTLFGQVIVDGCLLRDNKPSGGVFSDSSDITITTTTISGNTGGGVFAGYGTMRIVDTTISGNVNPVSYYGSGATFYYAIGSEIVNSTISGNSGLGVFALGDLDIVNSTIAANAGPALRGFSFSMSLDHTILGDNEETECDVSGSIVSLGHNVIADTSCALTEPTDLQGVDPLLEPLADNGGVTATHRPAAGSPAIDAGASICERFDQRGLVRPQDGNGDGSSLCDAGAVELQPGDTGLPGASGGLRLDRDGPELHLTWDPDCGAGTAYSIYRGSLGAGLGSMVAEEGFCAVAGPTAVLQTGLGDADFFLVIPNVDDGAGSYGTDSSGTPRPEATKPCFEQGPISPCGR